MSDGPKYRQRGYKDSERDSGSGGGGGSRGGGPQPPREKREGPRGRGLGAPTETVFRCNACGTRQGLPGMTPTAEDVGPAAVCSRCGAPLHTCTNCGSFDTSARWECRLAASIPARVVKKSGANDCPLFNPKVVQEFAKDRDKPTDPRAAFDALFK